MASRNYLLNKQGQILIESIFLILIVVTILVVFKQLIEFQKSRQHYRFSKNIKESVHVSRPAIKSAK